MPFNTFTVASAVTPSVIETYFSHFLHRAPLRQKPTAHISYHEGLALIRNFLEYASKHTVEDLQAFTQQWVPVPTWSRVENVDIPQKCLDRSAELVVKQLGPEGVAKVGGETWWRWRGPGLGRELKAEWIEMKKHHNERRRTGTKCDKIILYVHGGAYYFGSVDEHRYQMQRHARKLKARVLAPRYRLAPQFPFPCGLYDNIAAYLYCLEEYDPSHILFAGDSAGGGMVLAMLVTLRDQGIPLPAGTILLSPWSDLTHSFPSVAGNGEGDYIPPNGLSLYKPSISWPPPPVESSASAGKAGRKKDEQARKTIKPAKTNTARSTDKSASMGKVRDGTKSKDDLSALPVTPSKEGGQLGEAPSPRPGFGANLSVQLDGKVVEILDQIQLYATNQLLSCPLVSPVLQPSLGGLPPMLIQVGDAELLRDEQLYLAHKAANPDAYRPSETILDEYDPKREAIKNYPPTDVQLQLWDDLCHVPHTLSFTRPAKYMYRGVAQFGAWALSTAQKTQLRSRTDDDDDSVISSGDDEADNAHNASRTDLSVTAGRPTSTHGVPTRGGVLNDGASKGKAKPAQATGQMVGKAGDPLPQFKDHMIRQRVTRHGVISPLEPASQIPALQLDAREIGVIKPVPVRKYLNAKKMLDAKFAKDMKKVQKQREKEATKGYEQFPGEQPPPTALAARRRKGMDEGKKKSSKSWGLAMWTGWGSKHDEDTIERGEEAQRERARGLNREGSTLTNGAASQEQLATNDAASSVRKGRRNSTIVNKFGSFAKTNDRPRTSNSRSPWRKQSAADDGMRPQTSREHLTSPSMTALSTPTRTPMLFSERPASFAAPTSAGRPSNSRKIEDTENAYLSPNSNRPHNGTVAYPFKLRNAVYNPSTATLDSQAPDGTLSLAAIGSAEHLTIVQNPNLASAKPSARGASPSATPQSEKRRSESELGVPSAATAIAAEKETANAGDREPHKDASQQIEMYDTSSHGQELQGGSVLSAPPVKPVLDEAAAQHIADGGSIVQVAQPRTAEERQTAATSVPVGDSSRPDASEKASEKGSSRDGKRVSALPAFEWQAETPKARRSASPEPPVSPMGSTAPNSPARTNDVNTNPAAGGSAMASGVPVRLHQNAPLFDSLNAPLKRTHFERPTSATSDEGPPPPPPPKDESRTSDKVKSNRRSIVVNSSPKIPSADEKAATSTEDRAASSRRDSSSVSPAVSRARHNSLGIPKSRYSSTQASLQAGHGGSGQMAEAKYETQQRPPLETFVPANNGRDARVMK